MIISLIIVSGRYLVFGRQLKTFDFKQINSRRRFNLALNKYNKKTRKKLREKKPLWLLVFCQLPFLP